MNCEERLVNYLTVVAKRKNGAMECIGPSGRKATISSREARMKSINVGDVVIYIDGKVMFVRSGSAGEGNTASPKIVSGAAGHESDEKRARLPMQTATPKPRAESATNEWLVVLVGNDGSLECEIPSGARIVIQRSAVGRRGIKVGDWVKYVNGEAVVLSRAQSQPSGGKSSGDAMKSTRHPNRVKGSGALLKAAAARKAEQREARRGRSVVCSTPLCQKPMSDTQKLWEL